MENNYQIKIEERDDEFIVLLNGSVIAKVKGPQARLYAWVIGNELAVLRSQQSQRTMCAVSDGISRLGVNIENPAKRIQTRT